MSNSKLMSLPRDETLEQGAKHIAQALVKHALACLHQHTQTPGTELEAAVHEARKRCKELRGLARALRPALRSRYHRFNTDVRDAARELSALRDAHAVLATFDALAGEQSEALVLPAFAEVRAALERQTRDVDATTVGRRFGRAAERLERVGAEIDHWDLAVTIETLTAGLGKTYGRGRRAMKRARRRPSEEALHEWRKRVKYSWYHVLMLEPAAPSILTGLGERLHELSDCLGDDHDLAVLRGMIAADAGAYGSAEAVAVVQGVLERRRQRLQDRAFCLGPRLYVESREAFAARMGGYWRAWCRYGDESVGESP